MLVRTTLVRALYFRARLVTACPQLWNATSAMGTSTVQAIDSRGLEPRGSGGPNVMMAAAPMISAIWKANDAHSTHRRFGENRRWNELKNTEPTQKHPSDVPDLIHRVDSYGAARPSPKYTVFPEFRASVTT